MKPFIREEVRRVIEGRRAASRVPHRYERMNDLWRNHGHYNF